MQLTLHIGLPLSGGAAIRRIGASRDDLLATRSLSYPTAVFAEDPDGHDGLVPLARGGRPEALSNVLKRIAARAREAGRDHVILSVDSMAAALDDAALDRLSRAAARLFSTIRIVLVGRRRADYLLAQYRHFLCHDPDAAPLSQFQAAEALDADAVLRDWAAHFGDGALTVIPYEKADGRSFPDRFFGDLFDLDLPPGLGADLARAEAPFDLVSCFLTNDALKALPDYDPDRVRAAYDQAFGDTARRLPFLEQATATLLARAAPGPGWDEFETRLPAARPDATPRALTLDLAQAYLTGLGRFAHHLAGAPGDTADHGAEASAEEGVENRHRKKVLGQT